MEKEFWVFVSFKADVRKDYNYTRNSLYICLSASVSVFFYFPVNDNG